MGSLLWPLDTKQRKIAVVLGYSGKNRRHLLSYWRQNSKTNTMIYFALYCQKSRSKLKTSPKKKPWSENLPKGFNIKRFINREFLTSNASNWRIPLTKKEWNFNFCHLLRQLLGFIYRLQKLFTNYKRIYNVVTISKPRRLNIWSRSYPQQVKPKSMAFYVPKRLSISQ